VANFKTRISDLTNFASTDDTAVADWLNEGYRELVNTFPPNLKELCYSNLKFTSTPEGTEIESISTSKIGTVFAHDLECRQIHPKHKYKSANSSSYFYATSSDPVYYIEGSKLNVLPYDSPVTYYYVAAPSIAETDSSVDNFPDEAEYLLVYYASIKALQRLMSDLNTNSDITTALTYAKAGLDQAEAALDKFEAVDGDSVFGDEATFLTADSQLAHVSDALIKAQNLIDGTTVGGDTEPESAQYWLNDEDTEMVQATLQTAQAEIQRAQTSIQHWVSIGDMRAKQANTALAEANGYISEVNTRMARDNQKYQWYQSQQMKLEQDYTKGVQILTSGNMAVPQQNQKGA